MGGAALSILVQSGNIIDTPVYIISEVQYNDLIPPGLSITPIISFTIPLTQKFVITGFKFDIISGDVQVDGVSNVQDPFNRAFFDIKVGGRSIFYNGNVKTGVPINQSQHVQKLDEYIPIDENMLIDFSFYNPDHYRASPITIYGEINGYLYHKPTGGV
jgi:hypothetical protein